MPLGDGRWVWLDGARFDQQEVAEAFEDPPRVSFAQTYDGFWWMKSQLFDSINDATEIKSAAEDLLATINGCARLLWENHEQISAGNAIYVKDASTGTNKQIVMVGSATSRARAGMVTVVGGKQPSGPPARIAWLRAAVANPDVAAALRIFGKPAPTWSELYHLVELIEAQIGKTVTAAAA